LCFFATLAIPGRTGTTAVQQTSSKIMAEKPSDPYVHKPRAEPEIIPPGAPLRQPSMHSFADAHFAQRIYITKIGPFGILLLALAIGIVSVAMLIFLLGAFLFWIPVIGLMVAAGMIFGILKTPRRRR
jgi:hypothetical protein